MVLGWRRRKNCRRNDNKLHLELVVPNHFRCPISLDLMKDPVTLSTGITYDRENIERWFLDGNFTCPVTNQVLRSFDLIPNHTLRIMIQEWCVENQRHGVERIPTPRIPISPVQVSELLLHVKSSARRLDQYGCLEMVQKMEKCGEESERNKKCIVDNGATGALAFAFDSFANDSIEKNLSVLEEILSALNWMFPLEMEEAQKLLGSQASLRCMVWFLKHRDLAGREKSIVALRELLSFGNDEHLDVLSEIEGVNELLVEFITRRLSPTITKASLAVAFNLVSSSSSSSSSNKMKQRFIELGLVSSLLEILLDSERSLCEKSLAIFDSLCTCKEGREKAYNNALTIPVLVKKILRVSAMATDCSVSAIWKLCKNEEEKEEEAEGEGEGEERRRSVMIEALQVGAFQKLLVVLQIGCGDETKVKATELLKLLNQYGASGMECVDSDFKNLKRSH